MPKPVSEVNIHHTVTPVTADPCKDMRLVEQVLHSRNLAPGYSFCVHPSGVILEGAGGMVGAHTAGRNARSYGISFIGNYDEQQPTWAALAAAGYLIRVLQFTGFIVPELHKVTIQGHRAWKATACPGANLAPRMDAIRWFAGVQVPN
jgi:hypothetical protein